MLALRNLLLLLFGISIPVVCAFGYSVYLDAGILSSWVVFALWGYVVCLFWEGYIKLLSEDEGQ